MNIHFVKIVRFEKRRKGLSITVETLVATDRVNTTLHQLKDGVLRSRAKAAARLAIEGGTHPSVRGSQSVESTQSFANSTVTRLNATKPLTRLARNPTGGRPGKRRHRHRERFSVRDAARRARILRLRPHND